MATCPHFMLKLQAAQLGPPAPPRRRRCSFQAPVEVPGVAVVDFLWAAVNARRRAAGERELDMLQLYAWVTPKVGVAYRCKHSKLELCAWVAPKVGGGCQAWVRPAGWEAASPRHFHG